MHFQLHFVYRKILNVKERDNRQTYFGEALLFGRSIEIELL